ncbi:MAG: ATP-binding protein [Pontibacterium sp.]
MFWLSLLALIPLILVSIASYYLAQKSLSEAAEKGLTQASSVSGQSIRNWFDYRLMDLEILAESSNTRELMSSLQAGFSISQRDLADYIKSYDWALRAADYLPDLKTLRRRYDYIADIYFITPQGQIIFSLNQGPDLGGSLSAPDMRNYQVAKSFTHTFTTGEASFSGLEKYPYAETPASSFIMAPITNRAGEKIGVVAIKIKLNRVYALLNDTPDQATQHYLISTKGELLSPVNQHLGAVLSGPRVSLASTLKEQVAQRQLPNTRTPQQVEPMLHQGQSIIGYFDHSETTQVFSSFLPLTLADTTWWLVSEVPKDAALGATQVLRSAMMVISLLSIFAVMIVAASLALKISRPILALSRVSLKIAQGEPISRVELYADDEIGQLADAFNHMLTVRRLYEKELVRSSERAQEALEELAEQSFALDQHALVVVTDLKGRITYANQKFAQVSGYNDKELVGRNHRSLASAHYSDQFIKQIAQTVAQGDVWHGELQHTRKDGSAFWLDSTIVPFKDHQGQPKSFIAIHSDISARKAIEDEVNKTLALLGSISETTDNGIMVTSLSGNIRWINQRCINLWGLDANCTENDNLESLRVHIGSLLNPACKDRALALITPSVPQPHLDVLTCLDGRVFEQILRPLDDLNPGDAIWTFREITNRVQAERAMRRARDAAEDIARAKSEFLASMSHEIRTPMNGVIGMLGLLKNSQLSELQHNRVAIAQNSAQGLLGLIDNILDFSKVDAGKLTLESITFDLHALMGELTKNFALTAQEKGLELILDLTQVQATHVKGDPTRIRQIVNNLLGNAIKFTHQGRVSLVCQLVTPSTGHWILNCEVADTGIGIPEEQLDHLFDAFSQVDASTTREYGGTGLGLAITQQLCQLMNGEIQATSHVGKGSRFSFSLTLASAEQPESLPDLTDIRVLIADHQPDSATVVATQLRLWGAQVTCVNNTADFIDQCHQTSGSLPYHVAFIDLGLVDIEASLQQLKSSLKPQATTWVLMTQIMDKTPAAYQHLGVSHTLTKPVTPLDLLASLATTPHIKGLSAYRTDRLRTAEITPKGTSRYPIELPPWPSDTRVLLVEDNKTNQLVASDTLAQLQIAVDVANNGQEALVMLRQHSQRAPYSLIFMDCQMPIMDGYEATALIRAGQGGDVHQSIPIIAMTANAMAGDKENCLSAGMNDYISKPIDDDIVMRKLADWLLGLDQNIGANAPLIGEDSSRVPVVDLSCETLWDQDTFLKRFDFERDRAQPILAVFVEDAQSQLKLLADAASPMETAQRAAHTLKGMAANMACKALEDLTYRIELDLRLDQAPSQALLAHLDELWQATEAQICSYLSPSSADNACQNVQKKNKPARTDYNNLNSYLLSLKQPLEAGDYINANQLAPIRHWNDQFDIGPLLPQLLNQLDHFLFDKALGTLESLVALCQHSSQDESP